MKRRTAQWLATALLIGCADLAGTEPSAPAAPLADVEAPEASCAGIVRSEIVRFAPEPVEMPYRRCGTLGEEQQWETRLSPDHRYLAARSNAGIVHLIDTRTWHETAQLASKYGQVTGIAFSPDSRLLAMGATHGVLSLWNTGDGTLAHVFHQPDRAGDLSDAMAFSRDGTRLATMASVVDLTTSAITDWSRTDPLLLPSHTGSNLLSYERVGFVNQERQLLVQFVYRFGTSNVSRGLSLLQPDTGASTALRSGWGWSRTARDVVVAPDGSRIFVGGSATTAELIDTERGAVLHAAPAAGDPIAFSAAGTEVYTLAGDRVHTYDARDLALRSSLTLDPGTRSALLSPAGRLVAATDRETSWWNLESGAKIRSAPGALRDVRWSGDGVLGASSTADLLLRVWRESDGAVLCALPRPVGDVSFASVITPTTDTLAGQPPVGGSYVVSTSADGAIAAVLQYAGRSGGLDISALSIVDRRTGETLRTFPARADPDPVVAVVSSDGSKVYTYESSRGDLTAPLRAPFIAVWCR